ncbi:MAG: RraA family protein [Lentisphaeria bacterium]|nr:RraA family protein [Lentisphaeria bacterium]
MIEWNNDNELFDLMEEHLYTAVVGDVLDKLGYLHQFLPPQIQPLRDDMVVAGRAMTVLEADCFEELTHGSQNPMMAKPFGLMLEALDALQENDVYICTGSSPKYALWGELMSTRAKVLGSRGAVVDGYSRDTKGILEIDFPCFSYGRYSQDQGPRGKVIDFRVPIEIQGVRVNDGDIVFGDLDGVVVVPKAVEKQVIELAYEKAVGEKMVAEAIKGGMSCVDSWNKYGIM